MLAGAALRVRNLGVPRSFNDDEASVAVNVLERSWIGLTAPLDFDQGAPIGFLWAVKLCAVLLGEDEWVLRLVPLLAGIAALPCFYLLARRLTDAYAALFALAIWAFSYRAVEYSATLKPYGLDFLATCVVLLAATDERPERLPRLALVGALAICFSFPIVFVLAAVGCVLAWEPLRARRWPELLRLGGVGATWLGVFVLNLFGVGAALLQSDFMRRFWAEARAFMPLPPRSIADLEWFRDTYVALFNSPIGLGYVEIGAVAYLAGLVAFARRDRTVAVLLTLPLGLALLASGFELYPFGGRLLMFAAPLLALPVAEAIVGLVRSTAPLARVTGVVMAALVGQALLSFALRGIALEPAPAPTSSHVIARLSERIDPDAGDWVFANEPARAIFLYYARRLGVDGVPMAAMDSHFWDQEMIERTFAIPLEHGARRIWVLHAEFDDLSAILEHADRLGTRVESIEGPETSAYLYRLE